jgi:hypothetical protein
VAVYVDSSEYSKIRIFSIKAVILDKGLVLLQMIICILPDELLIRIQQLHSFLTLPAFAKWARPSFTETLLNILTPYDLPAPPASEINSCGYWGPLDWVTGRFLVHKEIKAISKAIIPAKLTPPIAAVIPTDTKDQLAGSGLPLRCAAESQTRHLKVFIGHPGSSFASYTPQSIQLHRGHHIP